MSIDFTKPGFVRLTDILAPNGAHFLCRAAHGVGRQAGALSRRREAWTADHRVEDGGHCRPASR